MLRVNGPSLYFSVPDDWSYKIETDISSPITIKQYVSRILRFNRIDVIDLLRKEISESHIENTLKDKLLTKISEVLIQAQSWESFTLATEGDASSMSVFASKSNYEAHWPADPKNINIPIHTWSAVSFILGKPGHAFTGVVLVGNLRRREKETMGIKSYPKDKFLHYHISRPPKMYLFPLDPLSQDDKDEGRLKNDRGGLARPVLDNVVTKIYKSQYDQPITHGELGASHKVLVDHIASAKHKSENEEKEEMFEKIKQSTGDIVGFTVHKGDVSNNIRNRYGFTSVSSNGKAFSTSTGADGSMPEAWGMTIKSTCDALLSKESEIRSTDINISDAEDLYKILKSNKNA